jgi:hypothetical protein
MPETLQPGPHLSPDQLSAFTENALPEHERLTALTHLADCPDCRKVVFLTQQADPSLAVPRPFVETPRRGWFTLPQIFVAATGALACTLILALIVHLHPGQNQPASPIAAAQVQPPSVPASQPPTSATPSPTVPPHTQAHSATTHDIVTESLSFPAPAPKPPQVQMVPPQPALGAIGSGMATGHSAESKMADKQPLAYGSTLAAVPLPPAQPIAAAPRTAEERQRSAIQSTAKSGNNLSADTITVNAASDQTLTLQTTNATTIDTATVESLPLAGRNTTNYAALTPGIVPPIKLPSKKPVASRLNAGVRILALDNAGALFLTTDNGKHWRSIAPQWSGKAVQLSFAPSPTRLYLAQPAQNQTQNSSNQTNGYLNNGTGSQNAAPQQQSQQTIIPTVGFQLITNTGAVWLSTDGLTWHPR